MRKGKSVDPATTLQFRCNICGVAQTDISPARLGREDPSCGTCGSSVRMRGIIHHLSIGLFGSSIALAEFPVSPGIVGLGLSDWPGYAAGLEARFDYVNTFYHQEPFLDITAPEGSRLESADFLISTDVLEHIPPPVKRGFAGCFAVLRPGGILVMTVPFRDMAETIEHFPDLHRFQVVGLGGEDYVLVNRRSNGQLEVYDKLIFHGGPGDTLEMRVFSREDTVRLLREVGFVDIRVHEEPVAQWGIVPPHLEGLPITARRPR